MFYTFDVLLLEAVAPEDEIEERGDTLNRKER